MPDDQKGIEFEISSGFIAQFGTAALTFFGTIIFARLLGPGLFGSFYLLFSVVQIFVQPFMGVAEACKKRYSEPDSSKDEILSVTGLSFFTSVFIGIFVSIIFADVINSYSGLENGSLLFLGLVIGIGGFISAQTLLEATGRVGRAFWVEFVRTVLALPIQLVLIILGFGVLGYAFGLIAASLIVIPISLYAVQGVPTIPSRTVVEDVYHFAKFSVLSHSIGRLYDRIDILLLGYFLTQVTAGWYEAAYKLTLPAVLISAVAGSALMVQVSSLGGRKEESADRINRVISLTGILALPILFGSLALSTPIMDLFYGPEYREASTLLVGIAAYRVLESQTMPLHSGLDGLDLPQLNAYLSVGTIVLNITLGVLLIDHIGMVGIVIATFIAKGLDYLTLLYFLNTRFSQFVGVSRSLAIQIIASVAMFVGLEAAKGYTQLNSIGVSALILASGIFYLSLLYTFDTQFHDLLKKSVSEVVVMFR